MTTKTYKVKGMFGKYTPVDSKMTEAMLEEWLAYPQFVVESIVECDPIVIHYRTAEGCERCKTDAYVPHYNCLYGGKATGHSAAHCTANACY